MVRRLVHEMAPDAQEAMTRGVPAFKRKNIFAVISPTKMDITLAFSKGAAIKDRYGMLRGAGKVSKHLKIKRPGSVDKQVLRYYLRQALELDLANGD